MYDTNEHRSANLKAAGLVVAFLVIGFLLETLGLLPLV